MIVDFPEQGKTRAILHRWSAEAVTSHSPEFVHHYKLSTDAGEPIWCEFTITPVGDDAVTVAGTAGFEPTLSCGRCLKDGPMAITTEVNVSVRLPPEQPDDPQLIACSELGLTGHEPSEDGASNKATEDQDGELDARFLDIYTVKERSIDLLRIALDAVDLAVPEPVNFRDDKGHCSLCHQTIDGNLVATGGNPDASNPFAALKGLKDKLKN